MPLESISRQMLRAVRGSATKVVHLPGEDTYFDEGDPSREDQHPVIYHPGHNTIYVGDQNTHHADLWDKIRTQEDSIVPWTDPYEMTSDQLGSGGDADRLGLKYALITERKGLQTWGQWNPEHTQALHEAGYLDHPDGSIHTDLNWNLSKVANVPKWDPSTNFFDFARTQIPGYQNLEPWEPGHEGKAIASPKGVVAWKIGTPEWNYHHGDIGSWLGEDFKPRSYYAIQPDGTFDAFVANAQDEMLQQAYPGTKPDTSWKFSKIGATQIQNGGHEYYSPGKGHLVSEPWQEGDYGKAMQVGDTFHVWKTDGEGYGPHHSQVIAPLVGLDTKSGPAYLISPDGSAQGYYHTPKYDAQVPPPFKPITNEPNEWNKWYFSKVAMHPEDKAYLENLGWHIEPPGASGKYLEWKDGRTEWGPATTMPGRAGGYPVHHFDMLNALYNRRGGGDNYLGMGFTEPEISDEQWNLAKVADYYHVAPTTERARIQQHGLQPSRPALNERWFENGSGRWLLNQPEGVYVEPDPETGYNRWATDPSTGQREPWNWDTWRIPQDQVQHTIEDPMTDAYVIPHLVYPELHEGPEHRLSRTSKHLLNWDEGNDGKGLVFDDGSFHTWNVDHMRMPNHVAYLKELGEYDEPQDLNRVKGFYEITPEGTISNADAFNPESEPFIQEAVKLDPRLRPADKGWTMQTKFDKMIPSHRWSLA